MQAQSRILNGAVRWRALVQQECRKEGLEQVRQGLTAVRATGTEQVLPLYLCPLAEALSAARQVEEALQVITEALLLVDKNGERMYEAELYRLKGELVLQSEVRGPESQEGNQKAKGKRSCHSSVFSCQSPAPNKIETLSQANHRILEERSKSG